MFGSTATAIEEGDEKSMSMRNEKSNSEACGLVLMRPESGSAEDVCCSGTGHRDENWDQSGGVAACESSESVSGELCKSRLSGSDGSSASESSWRCASPMYALSMATAVDMVVGRRASESSHFHYEATLQSNHIGKVFSTAINQVVESTATATTPTTMGDQVGETRR